MTDEGMQDCFDHALHLFKASDHQQAYPHASKQAKVCLPFEHSLAHSGQPVWADSIYGALFLLELVYLELLEHS